MQIVAMQTIRITYRSHHTRRTSVEFQSSEGQPYSAALRPVSTVYNPRRGLYRCCSASASYGSPSHRSTSPTASSLLTEHHLAGDFIGVVVVDHGSRRSESNDMLIEFANVYKSVTGRRIVEIAHMELAEPTIEQAVDKCISCGARKVIVVPYFLSRGRHIQEDVPLLVQAAAQKHPTIPCILAEPIGIDPILAQIIENRVLSAASVDNINV